MLTACGGSSTEDPVIADTQVSVTEAASDTVSDDERPAPSTSALPTEATPAPSTTTTPTDKKTEPTTLISGDLDASALLFAAGEASAGQSVRGELTVGMSSVTDAVLASVTFETDAEGNIAMTFSLFGVESILVVYGGWGSFDLGDHRVSFTEVLISILEEERGGQHKNGRVGVLGVSESGFYEWRTRPPSARAIRHAWLTDLIHQHRPTVPRDVWSTESAC